MDSLLIVEDDIAYSTMMQTWLKKKGFDVDKVSSVKAAVKIINSDKQYHLVLSDLRLPDHDGLFLLDWMRKSGINIPFIVMTSYAEVQNAVLAMKSGANDYIAKPVQPDILLQKIHDAINAANRTDASETAPAPKEERTGKVFPANNSNDTNARENESSTPSRYIEGTSEVSKQLYDYVRLVAPTPMSVLILGASGTGKEYVAHRIHELSQRKDKPFFALDCGAIQKEVAASEFFGHAKGAFTGAVTDKKGAFEVANGGTLFLDEVGNLSYDVQVQLLRAIQERKIRPLGSTKEIDVDIRLVCATNENLEKAVAEGTFREDLYHRINEFTIYMPALKDRGTDIFLFANLFLRLANEELGRNIIGFDAKASEMLIRYEWPGNLRELNNVVKRSVLLCRGDKIGVEQLNMSMTNTSTKPKDLSLHNINEEKERILSALRSCGGNKSKAAILLGVDRKTLYNKLQKYGI
ncbi:sigma-54 dependent transcriptional regulator [uncultured Prevotella sp.]|uniref:sigma-54-dependent transcriptional regulator n=1 Tax=uncultured Prevotella sp. TaxID=159272 RepID=UPI002635B02E|nr:sigma-54 dependent transcriptional regulator [uncultured Prevotella sp.]